MNFQPFTYNVSFSNGVGNPLATLTARERDMEVYERRPVRKFLPVKHGIMNWVCLPQFDVSPSPSPGSACALTIGKVSSNGQYIHIRGGVL
jgi:hypothetical protein